MVTSPKEHLMINVFQPLLGDEELAAVADVFAGGWLGRGPRSTQFEAAFAAHLAVEPDRLIAINSCTAGLFLAMDLLEIGAGDEVVMPSVSFVSAANAVAAHGARPVFCDVDPRTLNPSAEQVVAHLTERTKAVLLLHYGGLPGDVARIADLCRERGVLLIEDAACAPASRADGRACGTFGDVAVWSFDAMKIMSTGDGGMLYVRDPERARRARRLAYHGLEQSSGFSKARVSDRWWELEVRDFAPRVIGNDLTAAIGCVQLRRLPEFVARRAEISAHYRRALADVPGLRLPPVTPAGHETSHYFFWVQMDAAVRDAVAHDLLEADVYTTFRYPPLHKVPAYGSEARLPGAEQAAEETLCLPLHQALTDAEVETVVSALRKSLEARR
jgi:dTDP-4-amino-4,6-dideoxygalactose transaminase